MIMVVLAMEQATALVLDRCVTAQYCAAKHLKLGDIAGKSNSNNVTQYLF